MAFSDVTWSGPRGATPDRQFHQVRFLSQNNWRLKLNLNDLEIKFFQRVLNAELSVPVHASLEYGDDRFDIIVVPEIAPEGYFVLRYYDAHPYDHGTQIDESGRGIKDLSPDELLGTDLPLKRAWLASDDVTLQLHTSPLPTQPQRGPELHAKVHYAGDRHRGALTLKGNQVAVQAAPLKRAEFSLVDFPNFVTPEKQLRSIAGIGAPEREKLRAVASRLEDNATVKISPSPHQIDLVSGDGWSVTLTQDERQTRGSVSHTGTVTRSDSGQYETSELGEILRGLKYFFAFIAGVYHHPTIVVGYNSHNQLIWGEIGRFETGQRHPANWFKNDNDAPAGAYLEDLFPKFWQKWKDKKSEMVAAIECYVHSNRMRKAGIANDAVAKSYAGLEILASLKLGRTIRFESLKEITESLPKEIPHRHLKQSETPLLNKLRRDLKVKDDQGPFLLNAVRNYVAHPLDHKTYAEVKAEHLNYLDSDPMSYVYLHDLSQFYFEYTFLRFCGYINHGYRDLLETRHQA